MKKILSFICILLTCITLTGCASFIGEDTIEIAEIKTVTLANGDIEVTIVYVDEETKPTVFTVPKGDKGDTGETGVGIQEITVLPNETENGKIITINFTSPEMEPVSYEVADGVSILGIESTVDEESGDTMIVVNFSNGTTSDPIIIPKGKKGEDGNSITAIEQVVNEDKSVTLTLKFSQTDDVIVEVPAPQNGKDGRGIKEIVSVPNGDTYTMIITYTDDTTQSLEFARPNKWFTNYAQPTTSDGIDGDMWYDIAHNIIYAKENGRWRKVLDLEKILDNDCTITFDLNDSNDAQASIPQGTFLSYVISEGEYFATSGFSVPLPTRPGYTFVGWFTTKTPTVVNGAFTDLTPVFADLTLYACWEENN